LEEFLARDLRRPVRAPDTGPMPLALPLPAIGPAPPLFDAGVVGVACLWALGLVLLYLPAAHRHLRFPGP
jgi:hypothetical protein